MSESEGELYMKHHLEDMEPMAKVIMKILKETGLVTVECGVVKLELNQVLLQAHLLDAYNLGWDEAILATKHVIKP